MKKLIFSLLAGIALLNSPFLIRQSQATVSTSTNKVIYNGDATSTTFAFSFNIFAKSDLLVYEIDSLNVSHTLALNTDYTVSTTTFPNNGNVVLVGGGGYPTIPIGAKLVILRQLPLTQNISISDNSATPAATTNQAYDRSVMISQQLQEQINRSLLQPVTISTALTLPTPSTGFALGWAADGSLTNISAASSGGLPVPIPIADIVQPIPMSAIATPIADSNLSQITTASKVSGTAFTGLASIPAGAGVIPSANLPSATTVTSKTGSFTRSAGTTGTQAITGVGFSPKDLEFICGNTSNVSSWGFDTGGGASTSYSMANVANNMSLVTGDSIYLDQGAGNQFYAMVTSLDSDGFTLTWSKSGTPSGTASCAYKAIKY